jgi:hypothetical protein
MSSQYVEEISDTNIAIEPQGLRNFNEGPTPGDQILVRTLLETRSISVENPSGKTIGQPTAEDRTESTASYAVTPMQTGRYTVYSGGEKVGYFYVSWDGGRADLAPGADSPEKDNPDRGLDDPLSPEVDPTDYGMIVSADNQSGIALAPSAVREGITADAGGTQVELSDGTTVTVYPRQESDEAIRDPSTGDPVDTPVGSGGVEGGVEGGVGGEGGGMIGGAVAAVVLLVAGAAALLGGGE